MEPDRVHFHDSVGVLFVRSSTVRCPNVLTYIDPMSGTILLQVIVAGIIGGAAFFRRSIWRVVRLVIPSRKQEQEQESSE